MPFDESHQQAYCHLNLGEEATVVGFCAGLGPRDYVYTNYHEHGYAIGRGISAKAVMAELFGKETGCARGRGGSMHLFDLERRFMGDYAIVGGQLPLAVELPSQLPIAVLMRLWPARWVTVLPMVAHSSSR